MSMPYTVEWFAELLTGKYILNYCLLREFYRLSHPLPHTRILIFSHFLGTRWSCISKLPFKGSTRERSTGTALILST